MCSAPGTIHAQETLSVDSVKIDSLHALINQSKDNKERVRLLNEYARLCFFNHEYQKGFEATVEARDLSRKLEFKGGEIMYNLTLAAFIGGGDIMQYYQLKALKMSSNDNNRLSEYYIDLNIPKEYNGSYYRNFENELKKLNPIFQSYVNQDDKELQVVILTKIAYIYFRLGRFEEVKNSLEQVILLNKELDQLYLEIINFSRLYWFAAYDGKNSLESQRIENEMIKNLLKIEDKREIGNLNKVFGDAYRNVGKYSIAVDHYLKSINIFESLDDLNQLVQVYSEIGFLYETLELYGKAVETYENYIDIFKRLKDSIGLNEAYDRIVFPLYFGKEYSRARKFMALAIQTSQKEDSYYLEAKSNMLEGQILMDEKKFEEALRYLHKTYQSFSKISTIGDGGVARYGNPFTLLYISQCYYNLDDLDKALKYGIECLKIENALNHNRTIIKEKISFLISEIYMGLGQTQNAFDYIKMHQEIVSKAKETENTNKVAEDIIRSVMEKSEKEKEILEKERIQKVQEARIQRVWIFSITGAFITAIIFSLVLYRNNRNKQKANAVLKEQKHKIEQTLEKLKSAQSQLIQSEKMASLGELTAGIAHEIQNPLNFVNNFSEVSAELIDELAEEIKNNSETGTEQIITDLKQNLNKINNHGKRASSIVKGMLDHSRTSKGVKILTDINLLTDEYLRLSYHGLRAKDKSFNAGFITEFDSSIPKISIVPQDFGRVILNLINNAFYSVNKKAKEVKEGYRPMVTIGTKKMEGEIKISIKDNGEGISKEIIDKIFQPFFTTKPTGEGTGLGLSLAYDIVSKGYGGKLIAESKKGSYTEFSILLPIKNKE